MQRSVLKAWPAYTLLIAAWVTLAFIMSQFAVLLAISGLKALGVSFEGISSNLFTIGAGVVIYATMLAIIVGLPWLVIHDKMSWKTLGLDRLLRWKDIGLAGAAFVGFYATQIIILGLLLTFLPGLDLMQEQDIGIVAPQVGLELLLTFGLLVIVGPIAEELIFRGYLYGKLRKIGTPFWVTTLVVSLLFGVAHLQINVGIITFVMSVFMCITRELTGSIWASILIHMFKNGIAFYFLFVAPDILKSLGGM